MEKNLKRIKTIAVVLIIILVSAITFTGLYIEKNGVWNNVLPEFNYGMELKGFRELRFSLDKSEGEEKEVYIDSNGKIMGEVVEEEEDTSIDLVDDEGNPISTEETTEVTETTEEPQVEENNPTSGYTKETRTIRPNDEDEMNIDNYEKTKKIIQKRLESMDVYEYNIRLDNVTGDIIVEVPDNNDDITIQQSLITTVGNFNVIDAQNGLILLDDSNIKEAGVSYQGDGQVYLAVKFDKEGTEKLLNISKEYIAAEDTTNEATNETTEESASEATDKLVTIKIDDTELMTTTFGEDIGNGELYIALGDVAENQDDLVKTYNQVYALAQTIDGEQLPLVYSLTSDNYIDSSISSDIINIVKILFAVVCALVSIYLIIKFKSKGLKAAIISIGYIALVILVIKYTRVIVTLNSIVAFALITIINYAFYIKLLKNMENIPNLKAAFGNTMKELYLAIIPVLIIAVVFTFISGTVINSVGMMLFWGLFIQALYSGAILLLDII